MKEINSNRLLDELIKIIEEAKKQAASSINSARVKMYWQLGYRIHVELQEGKNRSDYGISLIMELARVLEKTYGSGFGERQLERARKFYQFYPIASAVRTQLNWMQYKLLLHINDDDKREYYELEAVNNNWTGRELERQINSQLYERLLLSNDKEKVLAMARKEKTPERASEIIKDPMILEFLGLEKKSFYYEEDLERALIDHLQSFLLELGNGFAFVARQKRILIEDDEFFADLVFYNRLLRCFVVVELKTKKLTHQDMGQLQMYVNYYDRVEKTVEENRTIGILLCTSKNETAVRMTLPEGNKTIVASEYSLYLPSKEQLKEEINAVRVQLREKKGLG